MIRKTVFILGAAMGAASVLSAQQVTPEHEAKARELVEQMTLEEKIDYIGGYNTFFIRPALWNVSGYRKYAWPTDRRVYAMISAPS